MFELIAFIIFIVSFAWVIVILYKKIPVLIQLPEDGHHGIKKHRLILHAEKKIKEVHFNVFEKQLWLHKVLSFIKVWTLKIETRIDHLLHGIRKKAQELDKKTKIKK